MTLYHLTLTHLKPASKGYHERFHIGVFSSAEEAEKTANAYLSTVPGFKDFPCSYTVGVRKVHGGPILDQTVYWIQGWNWNEALDEADIVESDDYASRSEAEAALCDMKRRYDRSEWTLNRSVIGRCDWQEGFEPVDW